MLVHCTGDTATAAVDAGPATRLAREVAPDGEAASPPEERLAAEVIYAEVPLDLRWLG